MYVPNIAWGSTVFNPTALIRRYACGQGQQNQAEGEANLLYSGNRSLSKSYRGALEPAWIFKISPIEGRGRALYPPSGLSLTISHSGGITCNRGAIPSATLSLQHQCSQQLGAVCVSPEEGSGWGTMGSTSLFHIYLPLRLEQFNLIEVTSCSSASTST